MTIQITNPPLRIQHADGSTSSMPFILKMPNGTLTDNGDGSMTVQRSPVLSFVNTSVPAGNTIASTNAETAFSSTYTIPANTLKIGSVIKMKLFGIYGTTLVAPTLTGKIKIGSTVVLNTGALSAVAGLTNSGWFADALVSINSIGSNGSFEVQGFAEFATAATAGLNVNVANAAPFTIDSTLDQILSITATWSAANSANTITLRQLAIETIT